jgi:hypothetical protein
MVIYLYSVNNRATHQLNFHVKSDQKKIEPRLIDGHLIVKFDKKFHDPQQQEIRT